MRRSWLIWFVFCMGSIAALAGMAWISRSVLDLDARVRHDNQLEENIRLALWRMDAVVNPLILQESGRSFADEEMVDLSSANSTQAKMPANDDLILARFQIDCSGAWRIAETGDWQAVKEIKASAPNVASLGLCEADELLAADVNVNGGNMVIRQNTSPNNRSNNRGNVNGDLAGNGFDNGANDANNRQIVESNGNPLFLNNQPGQMLAQNSTDGSNNSFNNDVANSKSIANNALNPKTYNEFQAREQSQRIQQMANVSLQNRNQSQNPDKVSQIREGPVSAKWQGDKLILARRVWVNQKTAAQGAVLNWNTIKSNLLASISDLLPQADLLPIINVEDPLADQRRLATIPVMLVPGNIVVPRGADFTPMRMVLLVAWIFMALGTLAVSGLLWGTLRLSRRREDFVSAVTHELRTPITSVSMYAEMLQAGMATDETKRAQYLGTLRAEAHRLGRLIENVLSFSRIERGKIARKIERMDLKTTIEQFKPRLQARAEQAELTIVWTLPDGLIAQADASALEQILFNLVDNAAKYAGNNPTIKQITIEAQKTVRGVELRFRDYGPGIEPGTKLFKPFSKSAKDAANSAPGVGLGLALSRRLARGMKGDLKHEPTVKPGACFVLTLKM